MRRPDTSPQPTRMAGEDMRLVLNAQMPSGESGEARPRREAELAASGRVKGAEQHNVAPSGEFVALSAPGVVRPSSALCPCSHTLIAVPPRASRWHSQGGAVRGLPSGPASRGASFGRYWPWLAGRLPARNAGSATLNTCHEPPKAPAIFREGRGERQDGGGR